MANYNKNNNAIYIIFGIVLVIAIGSYFFFKPSAGNKNIKPNTQTYENVKTNVFDKNKEVKLTFINEKGEQVVLVKKYNVDTIEDLVKAVGEDVIKQQKNIDINIKNVSIKNRTVYVDFDKSIKGVKFNSIEEEKQFIKSVILSLIGNSNDSFDDIQFLLDGQTNDFIFGSINTKSPFTKNPF